jgi:hypothetical protein
MPKSRADGGKKQAVFLSISPVRGVSVVKKQQEEEGAIASKPSVEAFEDNEYVEKTMSC